MEGPSVLRHLSHKRLWIFVISSNVHPKINLFSKFILSFKTRQSKNDSRHIDQTYPEWYKIWQVQEAGAGFAVFFVWVHLSVYLSIYLSMDHLSIHLFVCLSNYPSMYLRMYLSSTISIYLPIIYLCIYHLDISHTSIHHLSIHTSIYLFIYLSISLSSI
jgi:hypothetical protein